MNVSQDVNVAKTLTELGDVFENLLLLLSDKEKFVITRRFDLDNEGKYTLEKIGSHFSVTRERVRQIERNALNKMKRNVFNTTLRHLHSFVFNLVDMHGGLIRECDLVDLLGKVMPNNESVCKNSAHLSLVLHDDIECVGNTINFHPYIRSNELPDYSLKFASNKLVNQLNKYGDVKKLDKIHKDLESTLEEIDFDLRKMRSLISIDKRITLLNDDLVGLFEWRHIHPRTLREKILYILRVEKKPLHFGDIAEKISDAKFDNRTVNLQAVHNELIRHDQFVLIGRGIYALKDWGYEKGTVIEVIERILAKNGEMSVDEIVDTVLDKRQIKRITILLALKNETKFERVGRKRYVLKSA